MKEKKEVFESLRLELQEFTPQEFVATCYVVTISCNSLNYIKRTSNSTIESHAGGHSIIITYTYQPSSDEVKRAFTSIYEEAQSSSGSNPGQFAKYAIDGTAFVYNDQLHFTSVTFPPAPIAAPDPNVSG